MSIDAVSAARYAYDWRAAEDEAGYVGEEAARLSSSAEDISGTSVLFTEGDMSAQIAALTIRSAQRQRNANRDIQLSEEAALERAEKQQIDALRDKADDIRMGGLMEGGMGVVSGGLTFAGGFAEGTNVKDRWKGGATAADSSGKAFGGLYRGNATDDEANATNSEHEAGRHRRNLEAARDGIREGQDLLERALDFYKQSQQAVGEAANTSVRRG